MLKLRVSRITVSGVQFQRLEIDGRTVEYEPLDDTPVLVSHVSVNTWQVDYWRERRGRIADRWSRQYRKERTALEAAARAVSTMRAAYSHTEND